MDEPPRLESVLLGLEQEARALKALQDTLAPVKRKRMTKLEMEREAYKASARVEIESVLKLLAVAMEELEYAQRAESARQ